MNVRRLRVLVSIGLVLSLGFLSAATYSVLAQGSMTVGFNFATYIGGADSDWLGDVEVDADGNIYLVGTTTSSNFPTTEGVFDRSHTGGTEWFPQDCFVMKLSPDGQKIIYSTFIGGSGDDSGTDIAIDSLGNVYVTGTTSSSNFPTLNAYDDSYNSGEDCFVLKLSSDGSELLFSTFVGGSGYDIPYEIVSATDGSCIVVGRTESSNFPVDTLNTQPECHSRGGDSDGFVFRLGDTGEELIYSMYLGGEGVVDPTFSVDLDSNDNPVLVGLTRSSDFPIVNAMDDEMGGDGDCYVVKLNADGQFNFSTFFGGSNRDIAEAVQLDDDDMIYLAGLTLSTDFSRVAIQNSDLNGTRGVFVSILGADGNSTLFSGVIENSYQEDVWTSIISIVVVSDREIWLGGSTANRYFPVTEDAFDVTQKGNEVYITMIDPLSSSVNYSTFYGGSVSDTLSGLVMDRAGHIIVAGTTMSTDLRVPNALYDSINSAADDGFVFSLSVKGSGQLIGELVTSVALVGAGITVVVVIAVFVRQRRSTV